MNKQKELQRDRRRQLKEWAMEVKTRAGFACEFCGSTKYVQAHHIISKTLEAFRYDADNGIACCARCHKFATGLSAHQNPILVFLWLQQNRKDSLNKLIKWTLQHGFQKLTQKTSEKIKAECGTRQLKSIQYKQARKYNLYRHVR